MDFIETIRHDFSFPGHVLPGTAFIVMGIWWLINTIQIHYSFLFSRSPESESMDEESKPFIHYNTRPSKPHKNPEETQLYPATFNRKRSFSSILGCEGFIKLLYASFDLFCHILVVITGGSLVDEAQHITVYVFFILNALVDITTFYDSRKNHRQQVLPDGLDFASGALAWSGFGFLFLSHKHHKSEIQIYYHSILAWIAIAVSIAYLVQWKFQSVTTASLLRSCCSILAGSWLYQIAFTFHNPFGSHTLTNNGSIAPLTAHSHYMSTVSDHENVMLQMFGATIFTWHVILIFIFMILTGLFICRRKSCPVGYEAVSVTHC